LQAIMVFDLGGISHFTGAEPISSYLEFVRGRPAFERLLSTDGVDIYWRLEPCEFVMHKLERDKKTIQHACNSECPGPPSRTTPSPILNTEPASCGISLRDQI
jgi:hypothetical protein